MALNISYIKTRLNGYYQRFIKNLITLGDDSTLEADLKPIKIGEQQTIVELSDSEIKVKGTINADAINVGGSAVQTGSEIGATELNELSDVTYSSGDLTITSLDKIVASSLEIDSGGKIILDSTNASGGPIDGTAFKSGGTEFAAITSHHALSCITLYEAGGSSADDYFGIEVDAAGSTKLLTVDAGGAGGHIELEPDGNIILDPASGSVAISGAHLSLDATGKVVFDGDGDGHTYITESSADVLDVYVGGDKMLSLDESVDTGVTSLTGTLKVREQASASADTAAYGQLWVKSDTPTSLYFTTDAGDDIQLTSGTGAAGGGGTSRWHQTTGGYVTNKTSTTYYYFQYRPNGESWNNSDSSPTSINQYDASSCCYIAPADGTLTNITSYGYVNDTGATDPFKFYVYKGVPANNGTTSSLTLIATSDAPATLSSAARQFNINTDISSSNTFSAGDGLWVMLKKDSNTGNQDIYFNVTISGEYD